MKKKFEFNLKTYFLLLIGGILLIFTTFLFKTIQTKNKFAILALGDSYTIGEGVPEQERWPEQLIKLSERHQELSLTTIAKTGWTTQDLISAIKAKNLKKNIDLVFLLIGVNNQFQGIAIETYRQEFQELLQTALNLVNYQRNKVIVLSIPDWGVTPFAKNYNPKKISREIQDYNQINRAETIKEKLIYVDITPISKEVQEKPNLLTHDHLHPSGEMYKRWAKKIMQEIKPYNIL